MKTLQNLKAGIFIPTMNRADFIIRQLRYYASVQCPHTIYICDSSSKEDSEKIKAEINNLRNIINVEYAWMPGLNSWQAHHHAISMIKEPYACYSGDDDYQIPNSITKCAEFLENNPEYSICGGRAVSVRLKGGRIYGEIGRLADYPRQSIENHSASERIVKYFDNIYISHFSINRTREMLECWSKAEIIADENFRAEMIPTSLPIIAGKSKILECLGFVRQIHDIQHKLAGFMDWISDEGWVLSYRASRDILSKDLANKDNIPVDKAMATITQAFQIYLAKYAMRDYTTRYIAHGNQKNNHGFTKKIKTILGQRFPLLKSNCKKWGQTIFRRRSPLHYEVLQKYSKYYKDFEPVRNSIAGK